MAEQKKVVIIRGLNSEHYYPDKPIGNEVGTFVDEGKLAHWTRVLTDYLSVQGELQRLWKIQNQARNNEKHSPKP